MIEGYKIYPHPNRRVFAVEYPGMMSVKSISKMFHEIYLNEAV